jgi:PAS domain S-box-containing protein
MKSSDRPIDVLHVDDEPDFGDLTALYLERQDERFNVECKTNVAKALDFLNSANVDCIISDYDMPGSHGIEFLRTVREEYDDLPFILFTGKGSEEVASDAISAGVTDYLQKQSGSEQYELLANRVTNAVERYRTQQDLAEREQMYRNLVESPPFAVGIIQRERIVFANPTMADWCNASSVEELIGSRMEKFVHSESIDEFRTHMTALSEGGSITAAKGKLQSSDGESKRASIYASPLTYEGEPAIQVIGFDISEQRELEADRQAFRRAVEGAGHAIYITSPDGEIEYVNPRFETITGYQADEVLGKTPHILNSGEMSEEYFERLWETILSGETWEETIVNCRKKGEHYRAQQTIAPITDDQGRITAFVAVQKEINELTDHSELD